MPLIVLCGYPASGKTTIAAKLEELLIHDGHVVERYSDDDSGEDRSKMYGNSHVEKSTRARLKSAIERGVNDETVVIADSLNYIKGFRYELYCVTRAMATQHVVVYARAAADTCRERNAQRLKNGKDAYPEEILDGLLRRFEEPQERNRWDRPVFVVETEKERWESGLTEVIEAAVNKRKRLKPNLATVGQVSARADALHELDRVARSAEAEVIERIRDGAKSGDGMRLALGSKRVVLGERCGIKDLRKLRKAFMSMSQMHPPKSTDPSILADDYIDYINSNM